MDKQLLKTIIIDQFDLQWKDDNVSRCHEIESLLESDDIVVLSGIRRCGKSTLLQEIRSVRMEKDYYFNFDDDRLLSFTVDDFQSLTELFIELFGKQRSYYFDEIQNVKGWERYVRRLYDYGNKIFVTGSNASMLSRELGTHLTGRYLAYELYPFSFREYLRFQKLRWSNLNLISTDNKALLKANFNNYFLAGGFPAYLRYANKQYLKSLYESIIYRDVLVRNKLTNEKEVLELVHFIAANVGKPMSYNSLTKVINVKNATTVKNYISFLQDSYLVFMLNKYDVSFKKQLQNSKKAYMIDLALIRQMGFQMSDNNGRLLENLVFLELRRRHEEVYYHKEKKECDFVIKNKNRISQAIQVSWSMADERTYQREVDGVMEAIELYNLPSGLILTESEEGELIKGDKQIIIKPVWKWLLEIE